MPTKSRKTASKRPRVKTAAKRAKTAKHRRTHKKIRGGGITDWISSFFVTDPAVVSTTSTTPPVPPSGNTPPSRPRNMFQSNSRIYPGSNISTSQNESPDTVRAEPSTVPSTARTTPETARTTPETARTDDMHGGKKRRRKH